jgi:hypothetical protein
MFRTYRDADLLAACPGRTAVVTFGCESAVE